MRRSGISSNKKENEDSDQNELIHLPPSKTGTRGVISTRTLQLCSELRSGGVPFILVSGMRTTTLFQRMPYLPRADAYVSESGGRIFYPCSISNNEKDASGLVEGVAIQPISYPNISPEDAEPFALVEDLDWKQRISKLDAAGSDGFDNDLPTEHRKGKLWEFASSLLQKGYVLDTSGYATSYRINRRHQSAQLAATFDDYLEQCSKKDGIPDGLDCSTNLGCVDVYPAMSGKKNCAEHLVQRFLQQNEEEQSDESISLKIHAYCLCDDDNDIEMALACKAAYLPSITSESIRRLVNSPAQGGGKLMVMDDADKGIVESLATEAALEAIITELQ